MRIVSVNVGRPREVRWRDRTVLTAIFKDAVAGPVRVRPNNLEGDGQADLTVHGGTHKAVYAYATGHYPAWSKELPGQDLPWGAFGENLTVDDLIEADIRIGDRFLAGTVLLEVTQPRLPCFKLDIRMGRDDMIDRMIANGRTGMYFAILEVGVLQAGDTIECVHTDTSAITVRDAALLYTGRSQDSALLERAVATPVLTPRWRERFQRRTAPQRGDR